MDRRLAPLLVVVAALAACGRIEPVLVRPGHSPTPAPEVARVVCEKDGSTALLTDSVTAQADGVHVEVDNRTGEGAQMIGLITDVNDGANSFVTSVPPGRVKVACYPYSRHEEPAPEGLDLTIEDPNGYWVDQDLECGPNTMAVSQISDYFGDASGQTGDPVDLTRENLKGLEDDDAVERAGYPESGDPVVRVVRDGNVIALARFHRPTNRNGWNMGEAEWCDRSGISTL
jgi:hypothetical protein